MSTKALSAQDFETWRASYAYIPARLVLSSNEEPLSIALGGAWFVPRLPSPAEWARKENREKHSSIELDQFHHALLCSDRNEDLVHAMLSIVFWGYVSGTNDRTHPTFALRRARWMVEGKEGHGSATTLADVVSILQNARRLLDAGSPGDALAEVMKIKFLGMSFASKVVTFMNPAKAGVYDKVIAKRLCSDPHVDPKLVVDPALHGSLTRKAGTYAAWCGYCASTAKDLSELGSKWRDWDGSHHEWRAVDVERAIFAAN